MRWTAQRVEAGDVEQAGVESDLPIKRKQMDQEIHRIARENDQFAEAILEWYDASLRYEEARTGRRERKRER